MSSTAYLELPKAGSSRSAREHGAGTALAPARTQCGGAGRVPATLRAARGVSGFGVNLAGLCGKLYRSVLVDVKIN